MDKKAPTKRQVKGTIQRILREYRPKETAPTVAACAFILPRVAWADGKVSNAIVIEEGIELGFRLSVLTKALKVLEENNTLQRYDDDVLGLSWQYIPEHMRPQKRVFPDDEPIEVITEAQYEKMKEGWREDKLKREVEELRRKYQKVADESPKWKWGKGDSYVKTPHTNKETGETEWNTYYFDAETGHCDCPSREHTAKPCKHEIRREQRAARQQEKSQ